MSSIFPVPLQLLGISLNMRVLVTEWHKTRNREAKPMPVDDVCNLWYAGAVPSRGATQRASQTIEAAKAAGGEVAKWEEDRRSVGIITGLLWSVSPPGGFRVAAAQLFHRVPTFGYCFLVRWPDDFAGTMPLKTELRVPLTIPPCRPGPAYTGATPSG